MADGSSKRGVNIPVEVTGAEQAQAELRDTKAAVEGVGAGGAKAAGGAAQLGDAAGKATAGAKGLGDAAGKTNPALEDAKKKGEGAAKSFADFDNKGERAAKTLLGLVNPQLAGMADNMLDVLQGLASMSPLLIGIVGGASVFGYLANMFQQAAEKAAEFRRELERQAELERKSRAEGQSLRTSIAEGLAKVGVFGAGATATATNQAIDLTRSGLRRELAENAAQAQVIAQAGGQEFDLQKFIAGAVAGGAKPVEFGKSFGDAQAVIARTQAAGGTPEAIEAAKQFVNSTFAAAIAEAVELEVGSAQFDLQTAIDSAVEKIGKDAGFNDADRRRVERLLKAGLGLSDESVKQAEKAVGFPDNQFGNDVEGSEQSVGDFRLATGRLLTIFRRTLSQVEPTEGRGESAVDKPPTIINNITNIGTVLQSSDRLGDYTFNPALDRESFRR